MNQVLEFLAENYIYVAGGSAAIIVILLIIIAVGNKKGKNRMEGNMNPANFAASDAAALQPQNIDEVGPAVPVQEPAFNPVEPVVVPEVPVVPTVEPAVEPEVPVVPTVEPVAEPSALIVPNFGVQEEATEAPVVPQSSQPAPVEENKPETLEFFDVGQ